MKKITTEVKARNISENLRQVRLDFIPSNICEAGKDSTSIKIDKKIFNSLYRRVGESGVVYLILDKKEIPAMIEEVQWHPVLEHPVHISFKVVDLKQKTEAFIPVELVGKFEVPEAVLVTVRDEIEVRALPADLPEKFEIDVENLTEIGQSITLADLKYDNDKVEIVVGEEGMESPVVLVQEVKEEVEEVEEVETQIVGEDVTDEKEDADEEGSEKEKEKKEKSEEKKE